MSIYNLDVFCLLEASHTGFPISALIHACVVGSRVDAVTLRDQMVRVRDSLGDFLQRWQGIRQVRRTRALLCTFTLRVNGEGDFFKVEN